MYLKDCGAKIYKNRKIAINIGKKHEKLSMWLIGHIWHIWLIWLIRLIGLIRLIWLMGTVNCQLSTVNCQFVLGRRGRR